MTTLYLDTEFNGFGGALISIALHDPSGLSFYDIVGGLATKDFDPWVAEHVIPVLGLGDHEAKPYAQVQRNLMAYLGSKPQPLVVVADWPADLEHLFGIMNTGAPWRVDIPLTAVLVNTPELFPEVPHNALSDARALAKWHRDLLS